MEVMDGLIHDIHAVAELEGIENGMVVFQGIAYVSSPRLAGGVRSDLLFTILDELGKAGLPMAVPTMVVASPPAAPAS